MVIVMTCVEPVTVLTGTASFPTTDDGLQFDPFGHTTEAVETEFEEAVG